MALTATNSGTLTPVVGTVSVLDTETPTLASLYIFEVDTSAMQLGDELALTILASVLSAGTRQVVYRNTYRNVQSKPIKLSPPVPVDSGASIEFDLLQSAGTARAFPWKTWHL